VFKINSNSCVPDENSLLRLWGHECYRNFHDRLTDTADRDWFKTTLGSLTQTHFRKPWVPDLRGANSTLIYASFANDEGLYSECADHAGMHACLN
jgi:hypothetical protein